MPWLQRTHLTGLMTPGGGKWGTRTHLQKLSEREVSVLLCKVSSLRMSGRLVSLREDSLRRNRRSFLKHLMQSGRIIYVPKQRTTAFPGLLWNIGSLSADDILSQPRTDQTPPVESQTSQHLRCHIVVFDTAPCSVSIKFDLVEGIESGIA